RAERALLLRRSRRLDRGERRLDAARRAERERADRHGAGVARAASAKARGGAMTNEIYASTGVETHRPTPGPHSTVGLPAAAHTAEKPLAATFTATLGLLPGATAAPETMEFWKENADAYARTRTDLEPPERAMSRYVAWVEALGKKPVFVAYPAGFDFLFVY